MIGKPEWFERRKYGGWGLNPKTWQGWAYILAIALPMAAIPALPLPEQMKTPLMLGWALIFCADLVDIMARLKKDERERMHEALAERNAAWVMVAVIAVGIAYQAAGSVASQTVSVDPFLIGALALGLAAKAATNLYLARNG